MGEVARISAAERLTFWSAIQVRSPRTSTPNIAKVGKLNIRGGFSEARCLKSYVVPTKMAMMPIVRQIRLIGMSYTKCGGEHQKSPDKWNLNINYWHCLSVGCWNNNFYAGSAPSSKVPALKFAVHRHSMTRVVLPTSTKLYKEQACTSIADRYRIPPTIMGGEVGATLHIHCL